jgi:predicted lipid-binding transport protein (Tim44 family)
MKKFAVMSAIAMTFAITAVDFAEARRAGGGFGSRGTRTFQAPPVTRTAPNTTAPIDRTMQPQATRPNAAQNQPGAAQTAPARRPGGFFGGFGGSLLGGLALGGLLGMMMGNGFGGAAGFLGMLLQIALIAGAAMLLMRFLRNRQQPATGRTAGAGAAPGGNAYDGYARDSADVPARGSVQPGSSGPGFTIPRIGGGAPVPSAQPARSAAVSDELGIGQKDLERFEAMLKDVQTAYGAEDYGALRRLTTPEAMSWLAEELSENATKGVRNEVRDVRLLQGDLAESWREDTGEFATVAMRYESVDVTRDRNTGAIVEGDADRPTEATEVWTFFRRPNTQWQVSAIQSA